ncbi:MAG: SspB family protein [Beijerinckiaceae bacterium]
MATDLIRYDLMVQDALRGVVKRVLTDVAREGLPGEHHLYVSFKTTHPGVRLSSRLKEKHPDEMTIVLQHQFWDLKVTDHTFEVGLSFATIPERLLIPFDAVVGFFDPSVQFGLKFDVESAAVAETVTPEPAPARALKSVPDLAKDEGKAAAKDSGKDTAKDTAKDTPKEPVKAARKKKSDEPVQPIEPAAESNDAAKIVSLDAFRKKT